MKDAFLTNPSYSISPNTEMTSTSKGSPNGWENGNLSEPVSLIIPSWVGIWQQV